MNVTVSPERLRTALNEDSEFRLQARYWDGALQLQFGEDIHVLRLEGGEVASIDAEPLAGDRAEVIIRAPKSEWFELLQPIPKPLYQEFYPALWHHEFEMEGDDDYIWPYYSALRRCGEILRIVATIEED